MFEKASRLKVRFEVAGGSLSAEDVWDLPLSSAANRPNLDALARGIYQQIKSSEEVSFVNTKPSPANELLRLKLDIVKRVIEVKQAENALAVEARVKAEKRKKILELIEARQDDKLKAKTLEELTAELEGL